MASTRVAGMDRSLDVVVVPVHAHMSAWRALHFVHTWVLELELFVLSPLRPSPIEAGHPVRAQCICLVEELVDHMLMHFPFVQAAFRNKTRVTG